jgi:hypothetical protein
VPGLAGADGQPDGQVGLAGAGRYPRFEFARVVFLQVISLLQLM